MKFIHAADLHIDSPLRGLDGKEGAPVERLRGATRRAFVALVQLALAQQVDVVLLAGDIYDGNWTDFRTGLFFREQVRQLTSRGIRVFIARGNHDAESQITRQLPAVDGVHVFSSDTPETVVLEDLGVAIHGYSFPTRAVNKDVVPNYPLAVAGLFNIGVLHTSLTGRPGHDPYAPTTVEVLASRGYDYFALGHVHAREIVQEANPRIVYPGNLQGRRAAESGPKGCELVTVEDGRILQAEFVPLDVVRWHQIDIDARSLDSSEALVRAFHDAVRGAVADARDRMHAMRVTISGESVLHRVEAEQPGTLGAAITAAVQDLDSADIWIERVRPALRSPVDRSLAAQRTDALGEVVALVNELMADESRMTAWVRKQLEPMGTLPAGLSELDPANLDAQTLREALLDAEATVLAQLGAADNDGLM